MGSPPTLEGLYYEVRAFPIELRERVLMAVQAREGTIGEIAEVFSVSVGFVFRLLRRFRELGNIEPKPHGGGPAPLFDGPKLEELKALVQDRPDATLEELREQLQEKAHIEPSRPTVCRALQKLDLRRKKKRFFAQERKPKEREAFLQKVQELDAGQMVFIDERGSNINLSRTYARAPAGQRVEEALPENTPASISTAGTLGADKLLACCSLEGAFDGEAFATFIEEMVAPELKPGNTVIMDNVSIHQSPRVKAAIESKGATLLPLPTYSPDFDPIEPFWSKVKTHLRKIKARTADKLYAGLGAAIKLVTPQDIHGWFTYCGYYFTSA